MRKFHSTLIRSFLLIVLLLAGAMPIKPVSVFGEAAAARDPRVLVLNSYHKGFAWTDDQTAGITDTLKSSYRNPTIYTEYADWKRFPTELGTDNLYASLLYKYSGTDIDLIVATDDFALDFVLKNRARLFNNAPVIFSGVNESSAELLLRGQKNVTGVLENLYPSETVDAALQLNSGLKNIYLLFDQSESGATTGYMTNERLKQTHPGLNLISMDNMSFEQVLEVAEGLREKEDAILITTYFSDKDGTNIEFETAVERISAATKAPVYNLYDFALNHGAIGGSMISGKTQGAEAARLALRILDGEAADLIPVKPDTMFRTVFDYNVMQRLGVSEDDLPRGSEMINKPFSFYETYRSLVLSVMTAFVVLLAFILVLIAHIRQIRRMRLELSLNNQELIQLNEELEASDEELRQQFDEISEVKESLAKSEERFRLATVGSNTIIWDMDMSSMTYYFSERWYALLGYEKDELDERNGGWQTIIHPEDMSEAERSRMLHLSGETPDYECEYRMRTKSGEYIWFQVRGKISQDHYYHNFRFAGSMTDITERKEYEFKLQLSYQELEVTYEELTALQEELTEQYEKLLENQEKLKSSEERYRLITEATNDGIWEYDYRTKTRSISDRWRELLQITDEQISRHRIFSDFIHPDDRALFQRSLEEHKAGHTSHYQCEYRLRLGTGEYRWFLGRGKAQFGLDGAVCRVIGSDTDIHPLKQYQEQLHELAYFDPLSGLPNKLTLSEELARYFEGCVEGQTALFFLDIDNFKYINDTMGHTFGDMLLRKVSERLGTLSDSNASYFRLGGDEFVIFLKAQKDDEEITRYAERLLQRLEEPFYIDESSVHISASIGIAQYPMAGSNGEELLMNADVAMYKAKEKGKGNYVVYGQELQQSFTERMVIEKHLRTALANEELELYYQPQFHLQSGEVTGFEALIRWNSPQLGRVSPLSFIRIAEDCQLILPIGTWVLATACSFIRGIHVMGYKDFRISVNISIVQLIQDTFIDTVLQTLQETKLSPEYLEIEITESIFMESFETIVEKLELLKGMGIHIALDDFGTGYSSLSYLKELPITTLKVDKTFIDDVPDVQGSRSLASSIVMIGHRMGLEVIAEGVESEDQLHYLRRRNCDKIQGYLISRPLPAQEIPQWLKDTGKPGFLPVMED
ncbi:MAG: Diguanylate cyclase/phosphodiesterase domain 2 [Paenibacillaceae bacterium]|jgi:diguanylate cyclase (GGDEF)-like protein/PAS domain S-box-containing protein|nr:Diguanylate cyclase/phosphodiesterase domain 2 [Paenibacillaceae bacterium]